jgi:acyl-CoA thioesterase FadM
MNLWLRLIKVVLRALFARRIGIFETSRITLRVWPNDLDFNGHVNNGRFLTLADLGRIDYMVRTGALGIARRHGALPIVADAMAKFRRDLRPFQRFTLESRVIGWDEKWTFLEHRFIVEGRVVGVVAIKGVFRHREGTLPPDLLLNELGRPGDSAPALPGWVLDWHRGSNDLSGALRASEGMGEGTAPA